jgi:heme/copper-type cytochrome/quinol oxidase subunit 2
MRPRPLALFLLVACAARAEDAARPQIIISDHRFSPAELHVPANQPIVIDVHNQDATAEEFDSADLGVEKVIAGGRQLPVHIRPLAPGRYKFIGEYHADTAFGVLIAEGEK